MRIGIDARFYGTIGKGLGRYTQKLIENLEKLDNANEYFVFLRKENFEEYQPRNEKFHKVLADYQWYTISEQIHMPILLNRYDLDLVHFPHFNIPFLYRKRFIITIHDLILLNFPTIKSTTLNPLWYWIKFLGYKLTIKSAIYRSEKIVTVSEFTKNDILKHYKVPKDKIVVTYEAAEEILTEDRKESEEKVLKKYDIIKPYILYVGNAYPHKNLEALVLAYEQISDKNLKLVLVGKEDYFYKKLKKAVKDNSIIFTDFISDSELDVIYRNSLFYIFPSLYEGFGLPPLEAMKRGIPVAASNIPCLREILGNNVCYFDARNTKNISETIISFSKDKMLQKDLIEKGSEWVKKYSWKKMAEETLTQYQNINKN